MSRCECCDKVLTEHEMSVKFKMSGVHTNTCSNCLETMEVETQDMEGSYEDYDIISLDELLEQEDSHSVECEWEHF